MRRLTSPNTGLVRKVAPVSSAPSKVDDASVPATAALPPLMTVIKALATYCAPMAGTTPDKGAIMPPANPERAAPIAKVMA